MNKLDSNELQLIINEENTFWSKVFFEENNKKSGNIKFSSYWWYIYYRDITYSIKKVLDKYNNPKILEAGSGSGKASILLGPQYDLTLLDISEQALRYAKKISSEFGKTNTTFVNGDIFNMPFADFQFDFVWNIGVIEHYSSKHIKGIFSEILRVTNKGGTIAVGFPNFSSLPIIKAKILKRKPFRFIKGYRLGNERSYEIEEITKLFKEVASQANREIADISTYYFGNPLLMETPKFIIKYFGNLLNTLLHKRRFLKMVLFVVK